jgi:hypothetical protein
LWFTLAHFLSCALPMVGTIVLMERSNHRYAWVAFVLLVCITPFLFTGHVSSWLFHSLFRNLGSSAIE